MTAGPARTGYAPEPSGPGAPAASGSRTVCHNAQDVMRLLGSGIRTLNGAARTNC
jgi:hypothetical protein